MTDTPTDGREPAFNLPAAVSLLIGTMLAIHAGKAFLLDEDAQLSLDLWFAFIPLRLDFPGAVPGGYWPLIWTPLTHALLHANWPHVLINAAWLAVFGTPVARRYGTVRFFVAFAVSAVAGAAVFTLFHSQTTAILVGASGGISGLMGLAVRFIFQPVVVVPHPETGEPVPVGRRLATIRAVVADTRARTLTLVWLVLNGLTPLLPALLGTDADIAWQAHIGGFVAGFLVAPLLEARRSA